MRCDKTKKEEEEEERKKRKKDYEIAKKRRERNPSHLLETTVVSLSFTPKTCLRRPRKQQRLAERTDINALIKRQKIVNSTTFTRVT